MITTQQLTDQKTKLTKQRDQLQAQIIAVSGALELIENQIKESQADDAKGEHNGPTETDHTADAV